jgi:hypothetical protein
VWLLVWVTLVGPPSWDPSGKFKTEDSCQQVADKLNTGQTMIQKGWTNWGEYKCYEANRLKLRWGGLERE